MDAIGTFFKDAAALPTLPVIAVEILKEIKNEKFTVGRLADIISVDPALTAKVLRMANSSFYSLPYKVDSIEKAVNVLGVDALKNAALTFVIVTGLKRNPTDRFDHEFFWRRSITAAVSAEMIALESRIKHGDAFITSLLMDLGVLAMYLTRPDDYMRVFDEKDNSGAAVIEAEMSVFGFNHQDIGSEILNKWGIPENIYRPIAYHHDEKHCPPALSERVGELVLADMASSLYHGNTTMEKLEELKELLKSRLNITDTKAKSFVDLIAEKTVEILSCYDIDPADMKPCSEILQEANAELGRLNDDYRRRVTALNEAKFEAENLAVELWQTKEKMKEIAIRDVLTGLYNHRYFHELMDKEVYRIERFRHLLSLVIIDIDNFKRVNDTYGHLKGDEVLRLLGRLLADAVRLPDVATRYGGEEFAIVLPETGSGGAETFAERFRKMVEDMEIMVADQRIRITISVGITTYNPAEGIKSKSEIIHAADVALYKSKSAGKNRISVVLL